MAKKAKPKETVILIRIPDAETRKGEGTLTLTRADLGHMQTFTYNGLTLRGNIAEALQNAFVALAKLEASPPPVMESTASTTETPSEDLSAKEEDIAKEDLSIEEEEENPDEETEANLTEETPPVPPQVNVPEPPQVPRMTPPSVTTPTSAAPVQQQQIALF